MEEDVLLESRWLPPVNGVVPARFAQLVAAVLVLAVVLASCDSDKDDSEQSRERTTSTTALAAEGSPPVGRFFAVAGEQSLDADLYEVEFSPLRLTRLTRGSRVGGVSGCPDRIIVAAAQQEVGFADTIQAFSAGRLGPIEGLGTPNGSAPALTSDCRVAYQTVDRDTPELIDRLRFWDPVTRSDEVLYSATEVGGFDVGPDGQLAVIENTGGEPGQPVASKSIVIVTRGEAPRIIPAPAPDLGVLRWRTASRIAISRIDAKSTLFLDPATGARSELAGWFPLGWSPDGHQLLVADAADRRVIGVVDDSDLGFVRKVGTSNIGVYEVSWLPADTAV